MPKANAIDLPKVRALQVTTTAKPIVTRITFAIRIHVLPRGERLISISKKAPLTEITLLSDSYRTPCEQEREP